MTNIEALKMLKAKRECILKEIDPSGGCDDEKCDGCDLNYEQGCMGEQAEALHIAIQSLEAWGKIDDDIASLQDMYSIGGSETEKAIWENLQAVRKTIHEYLKEVSE